MPPLLQQFWEKINDWLSLNDQVKIEIEGSVGQGGVNKLTGSVKAVTIIFLNGSGFQFSAIFNKNSAIQLVHQKSVFLHSI